MKYPPVFLILFSFCLAPNAHTQTPDTNAYKGVAAVVFLDSFVVSAKRQGFNPEEFIQYVLEDESFYRAFRNLRRVGYEAENSILLLDKKGKTKASYTSSTQQISDGRCRSMEVIAENSSGKFFKGKEREYRYYTAKLFDHIFFTHGTVCEANEVKNSRIADIEPPKGKIEKHIYELKKLIFQPGMKADVPIIGGRTAIFSEKMQPFYNYSLRSKDYEGTDCYAFIASPKQNFPKDDTIIKYMETFFEKSNFQVVGRNYWLQYSGALFSFDVKMKIRLTKKGDLYLPSKVEYDGYWDIALKTAERARFVTSFSTFILP